MSDPFAMSYVNSPVLNWANLGDQDQERYPGDPRGRGHDLVSFILILTQMLRVQPEWAWPALSSPI